MIVSKRERLVDHYLRWRPRKNRFRWTGKRWAGYVLWHREAKGWEPPPVVRKSVLARSSRYLAAVKEQEEKERRMGPTIYGPEGMDPVDFHVCPRCKGMTFEATLDGKTVVLDAEVRCCKVKAKKEGMVADRVGTFALHEDCCRKENVSE